MRQNRICFLFILVFSVTTIPLRAQSTFATYPFSLDELVLVYAHTPEHQEAWPAAYELYSDAIAGEIEYQLDEDVCNIGTADDVDIANCLLREVVRIQYLGDDDLFSLTLAALFGLEEKLEDCMLSTSWDEYCLSTVIDLLRDLANYDIDALVEMHPCVDVTTDDVDAGCIIEGFMEAQVQLLLANGLQDWVMVSLGASASVINDTASPPEITNIRSEHFVDPNLTNGFSVVFVSLDFNDGANSNITDAERTELNQKRSNILMWSTLAMEHQLQTVGDFQQQQITPQYNPSDEVNEVMESMENPPDGLTNDNLILGLNWFATGAQSQGPGFGGPGSLPVFNSLGNDLPQINLPRGALNPSPVTIAILDVFPELNCGKGIVCESLDAKAALNDAFEHHGRFVGEIIVAVMGPSFHVGQVDVVEYAALTSTGIGSVETVINALHELYTDQGYHTSATRENDLVINLSLNLVHPYGTLHPNYDQQNIPAEVKAALSPPGVIEPSVPELNNGTHFASYGIYQRMRLPYALAIKAILGWNTPASYYSPFNGHVVFVGAAGNERLRNIEQPPSEYPARLNEVISVSSTGVSVAIQNQEAADLYYSNSSSDGCEAFGGDVEYALPTTGAERMAWIRDTQFNRIPADNQTGLPGTMSLTTNDVNIRWSGSSFSSAIVSGITAYYLQQDLQQSSPDLITTVCGLAPKTRSSVIDS